jgi:hypothetical protein
MPPSNELAPTMMTEQLSITSPSPVSERSQTAASPKTVRAVSCTK